MLIIVFVLICDVFPLFVLLNIYRDPGDEIMRDSMALS